MRQSGLDFEQLPLSSEINTASESSQSIGPEFRSATMFASSDGMGKGPQLYLAGSHANPTQAQEGDWVTKMTAPSGRNIFALSKSVGPLGWLERMLLESSTWRSTECLPIWRASATPQGRLIFQLAPLERRTKEGGFSLLPTPQASDNRNRGTLGRTPSVTRRMQNGKQLMLSMLFDGEMCPHCVEKMMGFPAGWSGLKPSETR